MGKIILIVILTLGITNYVFSQIQVIGKITDTKNQSELAYVNIGIKGKNVGTVSKEDGSFIINIPREYQFDSLTFSLVGYYESNLLIANLMSVENSAIKLKERVTQLKEVTVTGEKLVEKKYGIKTRGAIHFTDGIFKKDDSFEIGQVIRLGNSTTQITSINLYINSTRPDSASFRINFYRYDEDENTPTERVTEKSILQRHPIKEGWLRFDLSKNLILAKGNVLATVEFIPEARKDVKQIFYEVKIGGSSKSFFRNSSLGKWTRPPHHYCLYVTVLKDKNSPEESSDEIIPPTIILKSDFSNEPVSLFVRLPKNYSKKNKQTFPVVYLLDGNAYFDVVANSADSHFKKRKGFVDPIVVGIGYENAYIMDSLRNRDYTFPRALSIDSFNISGEGDKFYNFITKRVITHIDSAYRTDKAKRTIMGHSLGGYFVLYALTRQLADLPIFNNFVAASPSIYYHDNYLLKEIKNSLSVEKNTNELKLYLTIGELEVLENKSNDFKNLLDVLTEKKSIQVQSKIFENLEHMGTAIPTFENALLLRER